MVYSTQNKTKKANRYTSQLQSTQTKKRAHSEHCETVNNFGETEVGNFYDGWVIPCQKDVLRVDSV